MVTTFDIGIVGSGAAGLQAAIAASKTKKVALISDRAIGRSNSIMAQGGLHVPHDNASSHELMLDDMMRSARKSIDVERAKHIIATIGPIVHKLEAWGLTVDRSEDGQWTRKMAGGLSEPRIISLGDSLGASLIPALKRQLSSNVTIVPQTSVRRVSPQNHGFSISATHEQRTTEIWVEQLIICTGGSSYDAAQKGGDLTTNPPNGNHTMGSMLKELGLGTVDEEVFQWQPYGLLEVSGSTTKCVPESLVAFGGRIRDSTGQVIFEPLGDRLSVAESMHRAIETGKGVRTGAQTGVLLELDISPFDVEFQFPKFSTMLRKRGLGLKRLIVRPALHYQLGGFTVETDYQTSVPGLYLAGEVVGGLHGLNRLMGLGISESLVAGQTAGTTAVNHS